MQSSSEMNAIFDVGVTSMHNFPEITNKPFSCFLSATLTCLYDWTTLPAFLPALFWFAPGTQSVAFDFSVHPASIAASTLPVCVDNGYSCQLFSVLGLLLLPGRHSGFHNAAQRGILRTQTGCRTLI